MTTATNFTATSAVACISKLSAVLAAEWGEDFADATARLIVQGCQEESTKTQGGDLWADMTAGLLQQDPSLSRQAASEQAWAMVWEFWKLEERADVATQTSC
jgi:hypothetical protein